MKFPRSDKTMERIFAEFLAEPETCHLYQSWLKRNWPDHWRREYGRTFQRRDRASCSPLGSEEILGGFSGFQPHEVVADTETIRSVEAMLQKLGTWLTAKGYEGRNDSAQESIGRAARDLLITPELLGLFRVWLAEAHSGDDVDDIEQPF